MIKKNFVFIFFLFSLPIFLISGPFLADLFLSIGTLFFYIFALEIRGLIVLSLELFVMFYIVLIGS